MLLGIFVRKSRVFCFTFSWIKIQITYDCFKVFETPENLSITIAALFAIFRLKVV